MADDMVQKGAVTLPVIPVTDQTLQKVNDFLAEDPNDPMNETKKEIRTRFELLPVELQKVIIDDSYQANLLDIARKNKLNYEELGTLEIETTMVLLGMTKPADYRDEVQEQLKKNDDEADALVKDVNEKVFAPVREQLEKLYTAQKDPAEYLKKDVLAKVSNPEMSAEALQVATQAQTPTPTASVAISPVVQTPAPSLTAQEKTVLEKTGVVLSPSQPVPVSTTPVTMPSRSEILKGIESPSSSTPSTGMIGGKLNTTAPVMPTMKVTDYSVPKPQPAVPPKLPGADPYREPIN